jgi:hypothetical protein
MYYPRSIVSQTPDTCSGLYISTGNSFIGSIMLFLMFATFSLYAMTELIVSDMGMMCVSLYPQQRIAIVCKPGDFSFILSTFSRKSDPSSPK